jgi:hypothetical protein
VVTELRPRSVHACAYSKKQHGCTATYTKIGAFNRKSLKSARRMGWKPTGLVLRVRGSKSGGWPIITLWGSVHPLVRMPGNIRRPIVCLRITLNHSIRVAGQHGQLWHENVLTVAFMTVAVPIVACAVLVFSAAHLRDLKTADRSRSAVSTASRGC